MQPGICQQLKPFKFYSLEQFEYKQLISKSKYFVGLYIHIETKVEYVVKEVPYLQKTIQILKKIQKIKNNNIVPIQGISVFRSKIGWIDHLRLKNYEQKDERKEIVSLLLFMQKYQMNLHQYVVLRRKTLNYFKQEEIKTFINQTLQLLVSLQKSGISHRDIKPQNILYSRGNYYLCDFEDAIEIKQNERPLCELTTVQYSSPEYLRHIRHPKDKYIDPFKLDVYSFGLTLLYMCSMGKFSLQERANYIYQSSERSHADFIKQQRKKWIKNQRQFKYFDDLIKITLQEDQYKRDDFITLQIKNKSKSDLLRTSSLSDDNSNNSKSSAHMKHKKINKNLKIQKQTAIKIRQLKIYGFSSCFLIIIFILVCFL